MKNKDRYNLNEIVIKVAETQCTHTIEALYENKIVYKRSYSADGFFKKITDFFNWLEEEYKQPILDDAEKAYLSAVIKPFREEVETIEKASFGEDEQLQISDGDTVMAFPCFKKGTMYKGMEAYKTYTLKELEL